MTKKSTSETRPISEKSSGADTEGFAGDIVATDPDALRHRELGEARRKLILEMRANRSGKTAKRKHSEKIS